AAGEPELHLPALRRAAGEAVDDLPRRDAQLDLVVARALDVPRYRDDLSPRRGLGADLGVLRAPHLDDVRDGGERLDVVDQRGPLVEALVRREVGLEA